MWYSIYCEDKKNSLDLRMKTENRTREIKGSIGSRQNLNCRSMSRN